jgi:cellulose synthase/poly-beta-1,6-N-acetylglucosamine synthase-like glycosyltransferase
MFLACELRARTNRTCLAHELLVAGYFSETEVYGAIALDCELPFIEGGLDPDRLVYSDWRLAFRVAGVAPFLYRETSTNNAILLSPRRYEKATIESYKARYPRLMARARIITPSYARSLVHERDGRSAIRAAVSDLSSDRPSLSSRFGTNGIQGALGFTLIWAVVAGAWVDFNLTSIIMHLLFTLVFLQCGCLRLLAWFAATPRQDAQLPLADESEDGLPIYTVLVACYHEAHMAEQIVRSLALLDWPKHRLQIMLVCEADDRETIDAFATLRLPDYFEIIAVPKVGPRTKPKALQYALFSARGRYLVLYDAEDIPHPAQLREAWTKFKNCPSDVVCLQAPLDIDNSESGWLQQMFAFEYAALFRGLLPYLAGRRLLLPLGGTSNHFRRDALERVGGWDPFNVTEDADLGARLARHGMRCDLLALPTLEDAPVSLPIWLGQRTRWFKGWIQTWVAHNRRPWQFYRALGFRSFMVAQILFAGLILSSLFYPIMLATIVAVVAHAALAGGSLADIAQPQFYLDCISIAVGFFAFFALGTMAAPGLGLRRLAIIAFGIPLYWFLHSIAAWSALFEYFYDPSYWNKTPHKARKQAPRHISSPNPATQPRR